MSTASDHFTPDERRETGRALRETCLRAAHAEWSPAMNRPDPIVLLEEQNDGRVPWLVPVRRARMAASPFAFFRGSARLMAADLAATPITGVTVQVCGDAHLANFGFFASPERQLVFDINDFDETLAGPWEWDVKRLAASFEVAARHNGLDKHDRREVCQHAVQTYRRELRKLADMRTLDVWYAYLHEDEVLEIADDVGRADETEDVTRKAKSRHSQQALEKLAVEVNGEYRIKSEPPLLVPLRELLDDMPRAEIQAQLEEQFRDYQQSVSDSCRLLLSRFRVVDAAVKVVGVGSVGTRCYVLLLEGRDRKDPLFLQIKQASPSVLEEFLKASPYETHGQRVVEGQRLIQTASDIFLGWTTGQDGTHYYWRQLRDWKGSAEVEDIGKRDLHLQAKLCGWTLARAHARTGDPIAIAGYLGSSERFDEAVAGFAQIYADQNERDYDAFMTAIKTGRLEIAEE